MIGSVHARSRIRSLAVSLAFVILATLAFLPFRTMLDSEQWGWPYLLVVGLVAGTLGVWPAILAALLAFLLWNFLFIEPYYTLHVGASGDLAHLLTFLVVAAFVGLQTGRLKDTVREKEIQSARTSSLYRLSSRIALGAPPAELAEVVDREMRAVLGARCARIWVGSPTGGEPLRRLDDAESTLDPETVALCVDSRCADGTAIRSTGGATLIRLESTAAVEGILEIEGSPPLDGEEMVFVESVAHLAAVSLENRRVSELAIATSAAREAERLRTALISSVSHELKTPVASLTARVTDLATRDDEPGRDELDDALDAMRGDLDRLNRSIGNLLEASRLEAQSWKPSPTAFEPGELIGAVAKQFDPEQRERFIFDVPTVITPIYADFTQASRALAHLVDNALRYSTGPIVIGAQESPTADEVATWVADDGPGLLPEEREKVFDRFYRGSAGRSSTSSTGLGLSLAREFIVANKGRVVAENRTPHGTRLVMYLPANPDRTSAPEEGEWE